MQSPNVFKTKSHKSPRNPFDLGHDDYFTKSAGLLTPIDKIAIPSKMHKIITVVSIYTIITY